MTTVVAGALFWLGEANTVIEAMIEAAHGLGEANVRVSGLSASGFLPASGGYYAYTGSLTTPPYTEGLGWPVLSEVSAERRAAMMGGIAGGSGVEWAGDSGL